MLITSKNPKHVAREIELRQKAMDYEPFVIEPILWRQGVETTILLKGSATARSLSDIRLARVKWVERAL